ncbi:phosphatidylcholine synthase [Leucobacter zeae]|nr:phosphatidylcholine synthase [Leucobacter zeae]
MPSHRSRVLAAWSVHALTLTGVIWATLAFLALFSDHPKLMWAFLGIALIVDGVDGTLARRAEVQKYAPHFDGVILDSVVDYLTWTLIPAIFMYREGLLGEGALGIVLLLVINITSMFCYANTKMKTDDFYFMGFPAAWNIVALAFWLFTPSTPVAAVLVVAFSVLTWAPITFVHPFRVARFMVVNVLATAVWVAASAMLVASHPSGHPVAVWAWVVSGSWLILLGLVRTMAQKRSQRATANDGAAETVDAVR